MALAIRRIGPLHGSEQAIEAAEFDAFYADALPRIYGYFLRRCGHDAALAEDLTQETFVSAVRRFKTGERIDQPMAWLFTIARRRLIDHIRIETSARRATVPWDDDLVESEAAGAELETDSWTQESVEAVVPRLPEFQRIAILLHYLDDLSVPEVASHLGRSVHATESLLARGRANLRRMLISEMEGADGRA